MIVIADSGSTKTNWVGVESTQVVFTFDSKGINPCVQSLSEIEEMIQETATAMVAEGRVVTSIFFYGAGCTPEKCVEMKELFQRFWGTNTLIEIHSDLLGAARAVCQKQDGMACILGTGANSCLFLEGKIAQNTPALGFILGDEGSGAVLGRMFLNAMFKGQLPENIKNKFLDTYQLSLASIINNVYKQPMPNRFLASFSPFIYEHLHIEAVRELVKTNFRQFIERNLIPYNRLDLPLGVVGSVGFYYQSILKEVAKEMGITIGEVIKSPIEALISYHTQQ